LSADEQEGLSKKFIERLQSSPCFDPAIYTLPPRTKMTEEDCQRISDDLIEAVFYTLKDVGMTPREQEFLQKFSDDMSRPINDLVQFYLFPKTFSQKVKRLWRMQRIFIKMIKLIQLTNALALENAESLKRGTTTVDLVPSDHWLPVMPQ